MGHRIPRRNFLHATGLAAGLAITEGLFKKADGAALPDAANFTQKIDQIQMYLSHYTFFDEPDAGIRDVTYLDATGKATNWLKLTAPIAQQTFQRSGSDPNLYVQTSAFYKTMPYKIEPPAFTAVSPAPPPELIAIFQLFLGNVSADQVKKNLEPLIMAVGVFQSPPPSSVTAVFDGANLSITKNVRFRVQIRIAFIYDDKLRPPLGLVLPYLTNAQAAQALGISAAAQPDDPLAYDWGAVMTLATSNSFVRTIAGEPPPSADPFDPTLSQIELRGSPVDASGRYTIVGSVSKADLLAPPTFSLQEISPLLFGINPLTDTELGYAESGTLVPGP